MPPISLKLLPTADDVLQADMPTLGGMLLRYLKSCQSTSPIYQHAGGYNRDYFLAVMERRNIGLGPLPSPEPEYGNRQPEVSQAFREAWQWLEKEGCLTPTPGQPAIGWYSITRSGEKLVQRLEREERWEQIGLDRIKHDLLNGGFRVVGGTVENQEEAWAWVRRKENKPPLKPAGSKEWELIATSRIEELRALSSTEFDFKRLIRLCEEININFREECYFGTGALTRALLDHVPPLFEAKSFSGLASYPGGTKSFKDSMSHLDTAAKKIADGFLHTQIRKAETLPNVQQVNFSAALDLLLGEIVRIMQ